MATGVLESSDSLRSFVEGLGIWGPLVYALVSVAAVVFPIVPGGLLVIAAPVLFGTVGGTVLNYVAVCAGSMLNFVIARHVGLSVIERFVAPATVEKYLGWTRSPHATRAFATAIVLPVAPDDLLCYLAGTTRMRCRTFAAVILLGKPWALIAYGLGMSAVLTRVIGW
ncbi:TVP38/TMEM64 family protein [Brachybacterium sp. EF45031]|nr:TVP38/TMEM64 family protein [Brachybacterium sillae]